MQRLGRENAALLERAGVDDLGDLNLTAPQQQQLHDTSASTAAAAANAPSTEALTVEALSVQEVPYSQQQQQQQSDEEEEELPEEMQDMLNMLEGVVEWKDKQTKMTAALEKLGKGGSIGAKKRGQLYAERHCTRPQQLGQ
jgi:D-serine deaminase-like pyridoxal phosphate-dependent protein